MRKKNHLIGGAAVLTVVALAGMLAAPPSSASSAAAPPTGQTGGSGQQNWVTLVTGDRVLLRTTGGRTDLTIQPAPRSQPASFKEFTRHGDRYLLPGDVAGLVQAGKLDGELFNVTELARRGHNSGHPIPARIPAGASTPGPTPSSPEDDGYDLTVNLIDRDGLASVPTSYPSLSITNLDHTDISYWGPPGTIRLPAGRYAVHGTIETPRAGQEPTYSFISHPELVLDRDRGLTLDARIGKRVAVNPDNPMARGGDYAISILTRVSDCACVSDLRQALDPRFHEAYAATMPGTSSPSYAFGQFRSASEPALELFARGEQQFEVAVGWLQDSPAPVDQATLPAVYGGQGRPEDLAKIDASGKLVLIEVPGETSSEEVNQRTANIKQTGGKLAMVIVPDEVSSKILAAGEETGSVPALPTLYGYGPTAQRFAALVKKGNAQAAYASRPLPNHRYELAYGVQQQLTTAQVHQPQAQDLAAVQTAYHDNVADSVRYHAASVEFFGTSLGSFWSKPTAAPQQRTEYFTPGTWKLYSHGYWGQLDSLTETLRLEAGHSYQLAWNKAVAGPTLRGTTRTPQEGARPWAWRKDGAIDVILPMYGDAAGRPRVPVDGEDTGSISLYRDGALVQTVPAPNAARIDVPEAAGTYRLTAETNRAAGWWPLATTVSAEWTFRSSTTDDGAALPLLTARLDPAVDLRNRAPGGQAFTFPVNVERQGGGTVAVTTCTVDVSYDDGKTWQPATVTRSGNQCNVAVTHPATGYASLRVDVTDADGNTVRQTVLRAYQIGG